MTDGFREQRQQALLLYYVDGSLTIKEILRQGSCYWEWELKHAEFGSGVGPDSNEVKMWVRRETDLGNQEGWARKFGCLWAESWGHPKWWLDKEQRPMRRNG